MDGFEFRSFDSVAENMRLTIDDTSVVYYTTYVRAEGGVFEYSGDFLAGRFLRSCGSNKMFHILIFALVGVIVAYACIAFRDDPYRMDPWEDLLSQRDSRMAGRNRSNRVAMMTLSQQSSERAFRDDRGPSDSQKQRVAKGDGRPFVKVAL